MSQLRDREPVVTGVGLDEEIGGIDYSLGQYYRDGTIRLGDVPPGLDGAVRAIFEDLGTPADTPPDEPMAPAAALIRRLEPALLTNVFRWTGHFPERTRVLIRYLAERADLRDPESWQRLPGDGARGARSGTSAVPAISSDTGAGTGVFVSVVDTGWWPPAAHPGSPSPWLSGVDGDPETIDLNNIHPYAGHGTFIAGVVRTQAPAAEIRVEGFLRSVARRTSRRW